MLPHLDELEEDLVARRKRAVEEDLGGEIGLTLTFPRSKREQTRRPIMMDTQSSARCLARNGKPNVSAMRMSISALVARAADWCT
ncbi:hypothetical protein [Planotetraspora mira]|uniref:hypothetical protein n=1 Tax=Planotetraspora mira TaxID=58121 RepID=UPI00194E0FF1|nr:hypothetical protein [Planotetraspora mira]